MPREFFKNNLASRAALVAIFLSLLIIALAIAIQHFARKETETPPWTRGPDIYLRDVHVLADQTLSLNPDEIKEVKNIIKEKILDHLGPGDRVFGYRVSSKYEELADMVITNNEAPPRVPDNLPGVPVESLPEDFRKKELSSDWKEMADLRQKWRQKIDDMQPANGKFSDYAGTLRHAQHGIEKIPHTAAEKWLIIIGDLKHEDPGKLNTTLLDHTASNSEKKVFSDVKVYLIYFDGKYQQEEQEKLENDWRKYFRDRGNKNIELISMGHFDHFPNSSVPHPETLMPPSESLTATSP